MVFVYYLVQGYGFCLLGDVEEFWECELDESFEFYVDCFDFESCFVCCGRLQRVWGNYDDYWVRLGLFDCMVWRVFVDMLFIEVCEVVVFEFLDFDCIGSLVLMYGYQGMIFLDSFLFLSCFFVCYFW